jgi:hypothetical protein
MADLRFTTVVGDVDELFAVLDIDDLGDVETLVMFLFGRPVSVKEVEGDDGVAVALEVILYGNMVMGTEYAFPWSLMQLARWCTEALDDVGPYAGDGAESTEPPDVASMTDPELSDALMDALGKTRLFNVWTDED